MKKTDFLPREYRELTCEESFGCNGGGFAYDAGRLIRYLSIAGMGCGNIHHALGDYLANKYIQ